MHGPHAESQGENALGMIRAQPRRDLFSASALLRRAGPTDFPYSPNFFSLHIAEFTDRASPAGFISGYVRCLFVFVCGALLYRRHASALLDSALNHIQ